jgi:hypothetical protein
MSDFLKGVGHGAEMLMPGITYTVYFPFLIVEAEES